MTPEQADALFDRHCTAEAERDLPAIMATLADGAEHDLVGDPDGVLTDPSAIEKRYRTMLDTFANDTLTPLRRYHGPNFFVDESLFEATSSASSWGCRAATAGSLSGWCTSARPATAVSVAKACGWTAQPSSRNSPRDAVRRLYTRPGRRVVTS
jgi:hypothetical protein